MKNKSTPPSWGTPRAALSWYEFPPGVSVLETTGTISGSNKYDYIICFDPEKPSAEFFTLLSEHLKPGGRLLLALYNKYGLKHWCGARGGQFNKPFGEIEGISTLLSGTQLRRELQKAGFISQKWYYPVADHHYPKAVYSENKLPNRFFETIAPAQLINGDGVLLRESEIMPGVIENGMFTQMCDSFIVEAALQKDSAMCPVDFAAMTLYRQPERAFITAVYSEGVARKIAAHPEGIESLKKLVENHMRLQECGIEAITMTLMDNFVVMPALNHETLWDYMQGRVRDGMFDRAEFIKLFDRLRDDILKSSRQLPPGSHGWDAEFGPVLEYAYTEMIPANCFYDEGRGTFIYFDQEHALKNTPYSVPLSRALMNIGQIAKQRAHTGADTLFEELKRRYGIADIWDELIKIDGEFITGLMNSTEAAQKYNASVSAAKTIINANRRAHDSRALASILTENYERIAIYGFGKNGKALADELLRRGVSPAFIADRKTGGLPRDAKADIIVVTPQKGADEIAEELRALTDIPVTTIDLLFLKEK